MALFIESKFVRLSEGTGANAARIMQLQDLNYYQAREAVKQERKNGTLLNACGSKKAKTAVYFDNGMISSSPRTFNMLFRDLNDDSLKRPGVKRHMNKAQRVDVYDDSEEEEENEIDVDIPFDDIQEIEEEETSEEADE